MIEACKLRVQTFLLARMARRRPAQVDLGRSSRREGGPAVQHIIPLSIFLLVHSILNLPAIRYYPTHTHNGNNDAYDAAAHIAPPSSHISGSGFR